MGLKELARAPGPKIGNFIVEFATPGIGHILKAAGLDFAFSQCPPSMHSLVQALTA